MQLSFLGAAQTVTGSKYLLTFDSKKILIDCGLFQGYKELRLRNWDKLPINSHLIDAVILTHAHIDHSGYLPLLGKKGFTGPIYSTTGTKDLCSILLPDSAHLQEEDAKFANKYKFSKHHPALPLYIQEDAEKVLNQFIPKEFNKNYQLFDNLNVTFLRAGHIIGASSVKITYKKTSILFSGDLGRLHDPVMKEPDPISEVDYLVLESTYGNRLHNSESPLEQLKKIINETVKRGGSVLIPAFAVGRAQSMLYYILQLKEKNEIPDIPVFLDSPMAEDATDLLCKYGDEHRLDRETCKKLCHVATYITTPDESKQLDAYRMPIIIISASGMITGGRILHHIKVFAPDKRNTIIFTGYQAEGTRGARILNGEREIKIHGQLVPINAQVESISNMSAHADYQEIIEWLKTFKKAPRQVFIVHGNPDAQINLKTLIEKIMGWKCQIPEYLQTVTL